MSLSWTCHTGPTTTRKRARNIIRIGILGSKYSTPIRWERRPWAIIDAGSMSCITCTTSSKMSTLVHRLPPAPLVNWRPNDLIRVYSKACLNCVSPFSCVVDTSVIYSRVDRFGDIWVARRACQFHHGPSPESAWMVCQSNIDVYIMIAGWYSRSALSPRHHRIERCSDGDEQCHRRFKTGGDQ